MVRENRKRGKFQMPKSPYTEIKEDAMTYSPSERILELAKPKKRQEYHVRSGKIFLFYQKLLDLEYHLFLSFNSSIYLHST